MVSEATGRPIVRNFRPWRRRGRPETLRDPPVPVPPKWTGDRRFRTVTDVAEPRGPTGAGGPVVTGNRFRAVPEVAGTSSPAGTGAGGPVVAGTQFLAVAEVYAPFEETKGDVQGDIGRVDQISKIPDEKTGSHPLKHSGVVEGTDISKDIG